MEATAYALLAMMLVTYTVLDGFDFGVGAVHLLVAKTDAERRVVLAAIGPVWDGNEVWLIGSGGVLFFAFPRVYAAALSGLYLPVMMVLWLLVLRGVAIKFRSQTENPLWRSAFDAMFALSSTAMALVLGLVLGNLLRGFPLDETGYFTEDLFATIGPTTGPRVEGALDAFTALVGAFALVTLAAHGSTFVALKTSAQVQARAALLAKRLWPAAAALGLAVTVATALAHPEHFDRFGARPWLWPLPVLALGAAAVAWRSLSLGAELKAFLASCAFIVTLLAATAGTLYPVLLRSTVDARYSLTAHNASSPRGSLAVGLALLAPALVLAVGYFTYLYRSFRGKVEAEGAGSH